jgi:hypothetical protein
MHDLFEGGPTRLWLNSEELDELLRPRGGDIHRDGGFQGHRRRWRAAYDATTSTVSIDASEMRFIRRTMPNWRKGGAQASTRKIFERAIRELDNRRGTAW